MLKKYDADGDGKLSMEERKGSFGDIRDYVEKALLPKYDANQDGKLDATEIAKARADADEKLKELPPLRPGAKDDEAGAAPQGERGPRAHHTNAK